MESALSSDRTLLHGRHLSCLQNQEKGRGGGQTTRQKRAEPKGKGFPGLEAYQIPARKKVTPRRRVSEASVVPAGQLHAHVCWWDSKPSSSVSKW